MKIGTVKLKENVAPTLEDREVDPKLKASLEAASWTADKAVKVSGYLGIEILNVFFQRHLPKFKPTLKAKELYFKIWTLALSGNLALAIFWSVTITISAWHTIVSLPYSIHFGKKINVKSQSKVRSWYINVCQYNKYYLKY